MCLSRSSGGKTAPVAAAFFLTTAEAGQNSSKPLPIQLCHFHQEASADLCRAGLGSQVIGNVTLGQQTSIWYGAILRGEQHYCWDRNKGFSI